MFSTFETGLLVNGVVDKVEGASILKGSILQKVLTRLTEKRVKLTKAMAKSCDTHIIVRNPAERLVSFYTDKFIRNSHQLEQKCQKKMLAFVEEKHIHDHLFTFDEFIQSIEDGYQDEHILPQSILYSSYQSRFGKKEINILQMEQQKDLTSLQNLLKVNQLPQKNKDSKNVRASVQVSEKAHEFIRSWYSMDYQLLGYER